MSDELVRVAVNDETCVGAGQCEMLEPEVFVVDDDLAVSSVIGDGVLPRDRAEAAVYRCPGQAVTIVGPAAEGA